MSPLLAFRESVLAFSVGMLGGAAGSFYMARSVWQRARIQGDTTMQQVSELRSLHGLVDEAPRPQVCTRLQRAHAHHT